MKGPQLVLLAIFVFALALSASNSDSTKESFFGGIPSRERDSSQDEERTLRDISREVRKAERETREIEENIEEIELAKELSTLSSFFSLSASGAKSTKAETEHLSFTLNSKHKGKILITGFEVRSFSTGVSATISKGVELPFAGVLNVEDPIFISPGDKVVLVTGRSPTGYSFRVNKCTGYFSQFQKFTPSLPKQCPDPEDEPTPPPPNNFSDACLDFIESIPRCTMVIKSIPGNLGSGCSEFVNEKLNYKSCVETHKNDPDFYKNEWRVYLGRSEELWKSDREFIKLLDLNKKTVDSVTY